MTPNAAASVGEISDGDITAAKSTQTGTRDVSTDSSLAALIASRVFPVPPAPTIETTRDDVAALVTSPSSASLPKNELASCGNVFAGGRERDSTANRTNDR